MKSNHLLIAAAILIAVTCATASTASDVEEGDLDSIAQWIDQLDDDSFASRQAASSQLTELGVSAFGALIEAAQQDRREAAARAVDILAAHLHSSDADTRLAARRALHRIAAGDNLASMRRAEQALSPPPQAAQQPPPAPHPLAAAWPQFRHLPPMLPAAPPMPPQPVFANGKFRRVVMHTANGVKDIQIEEDGKSIKIHEGPDSGVSVEVTEREGDRAHTEKYAAESVEQLKEKSPEGYQLYEHYAKDVAAAAGGPAPMVPLGPRFGADDHYNRIQQHLDAMIERYRQRAEEDGLQADHFRRVIEHLEQHKQHLEQQRQRMHALQPGPAV